MKLSDVVPSGYPFGMGKIPISFSAPAEEWLRAEAARLGIPIAELVRRIIDEKRLVKTEASKADPA